MNEISAYAIPGIKKQQPAYEEYLNEILKYYNVSGKDYTDNINCREQPYAIIRQMYAYLLRKYFRLSTVKAGILMNKDHSTIIYSEKQIHDIIKYKQMPFYQMVITVENEIKLKQILIWEKKETF